MLAQDGKALCQPSSHVGKPRPIQADASKVIVNAQLRTLTRYQGNACGRSTSLSRSLALDKRAPCGEPPLTIMKVLMPGSRRYQIKHVVHPGQHNRVDAIFFASVGAGVEGTEPACPFGTPERRRPKRRNAAVDGRDPSRM